MTDSIPTILLLEDTRTVQNYIRDVLRSLPMDHHLVVAKRIEEAQKLAAEHAISVFIVVECLIAVGLIFLLLRRRDDS